MSVTCTSTNDFIGMREAMRLSHLQGYGLYRRALLGEVRVLLAPGRTTMFHRDDILRIAKERQSG